MHTLKKYPYFFPCTHKSVRKIKSDQKYFSLLKQIQIGNLSALNLKMLVKS